MMRSFLRRLAMLALVPAALVGAVAVASPAEAAVLRSTQLQQSIVYWTNQWRAVVRCPQLRVDARLNTASRGHSAWMARTGVFSHVGGARSSFVTRARGAGYTAPMSENIAWGYREGRDVVTAWMRSPGHRANIVNCRAKAVGVGVAFATNGQPYFTQNFGTS